MLFAISQFSEVTLVFSSIIFLVLAVDLLYKHSDKVRAKIDAEISVARAQAAHITQTAAAEFTLLEATIKAHEQNGVNKLRNELVRAKGDIAKIEELLRLKLEQVGLVSASGTISGVCGLVVTASPPPAASSSPAPAVPYAGQPSPGASIPA